MTTTSTEVATRNVNAIITAPDVADWGTKEVSSNDLIVSQILLMQGLSVLVADEKAVMGEFRDSLTEELLGKAGNPIEVIPFYCQEVFSISKQEADGSYKYVRTDAIVKSPLKEGYNDALPWEDSEMIEGKKTPIKRTRRYNFFVLDPKELAELGPAAMPKFISFKSKSVKEGKKLFNMMYVRNVGMGLAPAAFHFKIDAKKEKNEKGVFYVPTVAQADKTTPVELALALSWFKKLSGAGTAVKLHDEAEEVPATDTGTGEF